MKKAILFLIVASVLIGAGFSQVNFTTASVTSTPISTYNIITSGNEVVGVITPYNEELAAPSEIIGKSYTEIATMLKQKYNVEFGHMELNETEISPNYGQMTTEEKIEHIKGLIAHFTNELNAAITSLDALLEADITIYTEEELIAHNDAILALEAEIAELEEKLAGLAERLVAVESHLVREQIRLTYKEHFKVPETAEGELRYEKRFRHYERQANMTQGKIYMFTAQLAIMEEELVELNAQLEALLLIDTEAMTEEELAAHNLLIEELNTQILELNNEIVEKGEAVFAMQNKIMRIDARYKRQQLKFSQKEAKLEELKNRLEEQKQRAEENRLKAKERGNRTK